MNGRDLKQAGQQLSLVSLKEETWQQFCLVLTTVPAGTLFTCNSIRALLDWAQIPVVTRGALFHKASRAGFMEPATHEGYELYEPSTGTSARAAGVRVYRRAA